MNERKRQQTTDSRSEEADGATAIEAATATRYRLSYLLCTLGNIAALGLFAAYAFGIMSAENELGPVGLLFLAVNAVMAYLTRMWTDAIEDTSVPETVYERVLLRPGPIKRAVLACIGIGLLQSLLGAVVPGPVFRLLGALSLAGLGLVPAVFSFTQVYNVTLGRLAN